MQKLFKRLIMLAASLTILISGSSCTKKNDAEKPIAALTAAELLQALPKAGDEAAQIDTDEKPLIKKVDSRPVSKSEPVAKQPTAPVAPSTPVTPVTQSHASEAPVVKIVVKNMTLLAALATDKLSALHAAKVVALIDIEKSIKNSNEDHYCQVTMTGNLLANDKLALEKNERKQIDKEFDVFLSELQFLNATGSLVFSCYHTTPNFFIEDFSINFSAYLDVLMPDGAVLKTTGYVNEKTLKRKLNAVRIKDPQKLEKLVLTDTGTSQALVKQEILTADDAVSAVEANTAKMACVIDEKSGEFDPKLIYIGVEKGVAKETAKNISTATVFTIYRANDTHFFRLVCVVQKDTPWFELMETTKGTIEFGVLGRLDYNKKYDEVKAVHTQLQTTKPR